MTVDSKSWKNTFARFFAVFCLVLLLLALLAHRVFHPR
jgi:hypothetical protein